MLLYPGARVSILAVRNRHDTILRTPVAARFYVVLPRTFKQPGPVANGTSALSFLTFSSVNFRSSTSCARSASARHQRTGPTASADAGGARSAAFLQHLVDVGLRDVKRGRQAEDHAGAQADRGQIAEYGAVHRELDPVGAADLLRGLVEQADPDN